MTKSTRVTIELVGPPFFGAIGMYVMYARAIADGPGLGVGPFFAYLFWAFLACAIPSALYAFAMELWFGRGLAERYGALGVVGLSSLIGIAAGTTIWLATEARVSWIGGAVGLLLGIILAWGRTNHK